MSRKCDRGPVVVNPDLSLPYELQQELPLGAAETNVTTAEEAIDVVLAKRAGKLDEFNSPTSPSTVFPSFSSARPGAHTLTSSRNGTEASIVTVDLRT